jgi:hypothetical protein
MDGEESEIGEGSEKGPGLYCERYTNHTRNKCPIGTHKLRDELGTDCWSLWAFTGVLYIQILVLNGLCALIISLPARCNASPTCYGE